MSKPDEQQLIRDIINRFEALKLYRKTIEQAYIDRDRELSQFIRSASQRAAEQSEWMRQQPRRWD